MKPQGVQNLKFKIETVNGGFRLIYLEMQI
jgi:hypothetical protein